jgi:hypothetical protein
MWSRASSHGDIDNRLKTLFDCLTLPDPNQGYEAETPAQDELPYFYCLLEDDRLICHHDPYGWVHQPVQVESRPAVAGRKSYLAMQICNDMKRYDRFFIRHSTACYAKLRPTRD